MQTKTTPDDNGADPAIEPPKAFAQSAAGVDPLSGQHFYALFEQHIRETGNEKSYDEHEHKLSDPSNHWGELPDNSRIAFTRAAAEFIKPLIESIKRKEDRIRSLNENTITPLSAELEKLARWREGITITVARVAGPQAFTTLEGQYQFFPSTERILALLETLMSELEEYRACFRFLGHDMPSNPFGASRFAAMLMSRFEHLRESSFAKDVDLMEARIRADDLACANASLSRALGTVYEKVVVAANGIPLTGEHKIPADVFVTEVLREFENLHSWIGWLANQVMELEGGEVVGRVMSRQVTQGMEGALAGAATAGENTTRRPPEMVVDEAQNTGKSDTILMGPQAGRFHAAH